MKGLHLILELCSSFSKDAERMFVKYNCGCGKKLDNEYFVLKDRKSRRN